MAENRTFKEGSVWFVAGSGSGRSWATASAPASGLFGFVQEGMTINSGQTLMPIADRGVPNHWKKQSEEVISFSMTFNWTGTYPTAVSGSGASVPLWHIEHKAIAPENGSTGVYHQLHGVVIDSYNLTEGSPNTIAVQGRALAMNGPTASGYLS